MHSLHSQDKTYENYSDQLALAMNFAWFLWLANLIESTSIIMLVCASPSCGSIASQPASTFICCNLCCCTLRDFWLIHFAQHLFWESARSCKAKLARALRSFHDLKTTGTRLYEGFGPGPLEFSVDCIVQTLIASLDHEFLCLSCQGCLFAPGI